MSQHYTAADRSYDLWAFAKDYGAEDFEADADEAGAEHRATAEMVQDQLHKLPQDRNIVGMFAAGICADNGILPDEDGA